MHQITPNGTIRYYCMSDNVKIANANNHLKHGTFKSVTNQKYCTRQRQLGKMLHNQLLKTWLKKLNLSTKDFCKMTNDSVDPKVLFFLQDIIVNSATSIKSHLSDSFYNEIRKTEDVFQSEIEPNNHDTGN